MTSIDSDAGDGLIEAAIAAGHMGARLAVIEHERDDLQPVHQYGAQGVWTNQLGTLIITTPTSADSEPQENPFIIGTLATWGTWDRYTDLEAMLEILADQEHTIYLRLQSTVSNSGGDDEEGGDDDGGEVNWSGYAFRYVRGEEEVAEIQIWLVVDNFLDTLLASAEIAALQPGDWILAVAHGSRLSMRTSTGASIKGVDATYSRGMVGVGQAEGLVPTSLGNFRVFELDHGPR